MSNTEVIVDILDTTLRDGAQSLPEVNQFQEGSKYKITKKLAEFGIGVIEAGFPASRNDKGDLTDFDEFQETARRITEPIAVKEWQNGENIGTVERIPIIAGLTSAVPEHIELTWEALHVAANPRTHTFISTDRGHMEAKFPGMTPDEVLSMGIKGIRTAKELSADHPGATTEFSAEAASTTDDIFLERVIKSSVDEGINVFNSPDTVGQKNPFQMLEHYTKVIEWAKSVNPNIKISAHPHNDLGNAVANTIALVHAAVDYARLHSDSVHVQLETTVCGLGERGGNADVFPVLANLFKFFSKDHDIPVKWLINPHMAVPTANEIMSYGNMEVHRQNPVIGRDTNVHRSGIHSSGVLKGGHTIYSPYDPRFWGHIQSAVHEDGKYQGRAGRSAVK